MSKNTKTIVIIVAVVIALLILIPAFYGLFSGGYGGNSGWYGIMGPWIMGGFGGIWMMGILWLVVLGLIIWFVIYLVKSSGSHLNLGGGSSETALEILKRRYASGEINKEEFEQKRKALEQ